MTMVHVVATVVFGTLLLALAVIDIKTFRLPDSLTFSVLVLAIMTGPQEADDRVGGMILATGLLLLVAVAFRVLRGVDGLGLGDIKLMAGCGAWVGVQGVGPTILLGSLVALIVARTSVRPVERVATGHAFAPAGAIAFGPYLALATLAVACAQAAELL